jgi:hypothetical protein
MVFDQPPMPLQCSFCEQLLLPDFKLAPWWAICMNCQHDPLGQCSCVLEWTDTNLVDTKNDRPPRATGMSPHFLGDLIKGRYAQSMEEVYTFEEADTFVKDLWSGLFELADYDAILDSKIEEIINRVVRAQPRTIFHPRCRRTFDVYDRLLLSRNVPDLIDVAKDMLKVLFEIGKTQPLVDGSDRIRIWREEIAYVLRWQLPDSGTLQFNDRWAPAIQYR